MVTYRQTTIVGIVITIITCIGIGLAIYFLLFQNSFTLSNIKIVEVPFLDAMNGKYKVISNDTFYKSLQSTFTDSSNSPYFYIEEGKLVMFQSTSKGKFYVNTIFKNTNSDYPSNYQYEENALQAYILKIYSTTNSSLVKYFALIVTSDESVSFNFDIVSGTDSLPTFCDSIKSSTDFAINSNYSMVTSSIHCKKNGLI